MMMMIWVLGRSNTLVGKRELAKNLQTDERNGRIPTVATVHGCHQSVYSTVDVKRDVAVRVFS